MVYPPIRRQERSRLNKLVNSTLILRMKHGWITGTSSWIGPDSSAVEAIMEGGFDWKDYNFIAAETWTFPRSASKTLDEINRQSFCVFSLTFSWRNRSLTQTLFHLEIIERSFQLSSLTLVGVYSMIKFSIHVITLKACMPFVTHRGPISIHPDFLAFFQPWKLAGGNSFDKLPSGCSDRDPFIPMDSLNSPSHAQLRWRRSSVFWI